MQSENGKLLGEYEEVKEFSLKTSSEKKMISIVKESPKMQVPSKPKMFPEESDLKGYYSQYLAPLSPNKKIDLRDGERENSMNSNLSQGFGYNHDDFGSFNKQNPMNLSKPTEINFDSLNMLPNTSNFAYNMLSKKTDAFKTSSIQLGVTLNLASSELSLQSASDDSYVYDLNTISGLLNLNLSKHKKIVIEMIDDSRIKVTTSHKEPTASKLDLYFTKSSSLHDKYFI